MTPGEMIEERPIKFYNQLGSLIKHYAVLSFVCSSFPCMHAFYFQFNGKNLVIMLTIKVPKVGLVPNPDGLYIIYYRRKYIYEIGLTPQICF